MFHANARNLPNTVIGQRAQLATGFAHAVQTLERMWEKTRYMPGVAHPTTDQPSATSFGVRNPVTNSWHFHPRTHEKVPGPDTIHRRGVNAMQQDERGCP